MNDIRFVERKPNGSVDIALATDSVVPGVTLRTPLRTIHRKAVEQARHLRQLHSYIGYSIAGMKPVYFSDGEL